MFLTGFTSLIVLLLFHHQSPSSHSFDSISSNIDEVLSINPSAVFVFGDFNVHHKDWPTYSGGTDWPGEFCYNFSISNDQMINFPTRIPDCDSHSPALSSDTSIYLFYNGFPSIRQFWSHCSLSFHWLSIKFTTGFDYSHADWEHLCDHLRDVPWEDIFKLGASAAATEFCKWVHVGTDVFIPHRKYRVKPHTSPWFSAASANVIVHKNHFFSLSA